jgi:hypothetical protein
MLHLLLQSLQLRVMQLQYLLETLEESQEFSGLAGEYCQSISAARMSNRA